MKLIGKVFCRSFYFENLNCFCFLMEDRYHCEKKVLKESRWVSWIYVVDVYDEFIGSRFPS